MVCVSTACPHPARRTAPRVPWNQRNPLFCTLHGALPSRRRWRRAPMPTPETTMSPCAGHCVWGEGAPERAPRPLATHQRRHRAADRDDHSPVHTWSAREPLELVADGGGAVASPPGRLAARPLPRWECRARSGNSPPRICTCGRPGLMAQWALWGWDLWWWRFHQAVVPRPWIQRAECRTAALVPGADCVQGGVVCGCTAHVNGQLVASIHDVALPLRVEGGVDRVRREGCAIVGTARCCRTFKR